MSNVVALKAYAQPRNKLRELRNMYGLSITEASLCLKMSPSAIEEMEQGRRFHAKFKAIKIAYENWIGSNQNKGGKNLLFGTYPLKVAREILGLDVAKMADRYDYGVDMWRKLENHSRVLPPETKRRIEQDVKKHFLVACKCLT